MSSHVTNGNSVETLKSFMLAGVDIPTPVCWEVTRDLEDLGLTFFKWVAPNAFADTTLTRTKPLH